MKELFKPVTKHDAAKLRKYYQDCSYGLCEYSVGTKLMWRKTLHPAWAEVAGCLVVRNLVDGQAVFDYPVPEMCIRDRCRADRVGPTLTVGGCGYDARGFGKN